MNPAIASFLSDSVAGGGLSNTSSAESGAKGESSLTDYSNRSNVNKVNLPFNVAGRGSNLESGRDNNLQNLLLFGLGAVVVVALIRRF